jgi:uncharacterized protein involved in tolerance to divalent cations
MEFLRTGAVRVPADEEAAVAVRHPLETRCPALHRCRVPEIIALPTVAASDDYVKWLEAETE